VKENNFRYAFNIQNQSAFASASNYKQYDILAFLKDNNYCKAPNDKLINFEKPEKELERLAMLPYFKSPKNSYIIHLLNHSKLLNDNINADVSFKKILELYTALNEVEEVKSILMFFQHIDDFEIIFDFGSSHVGKATPADTNENIGGIFYSSSPYHIYIGAKRHDQEIMGTLIHELTHLLMKLMYENSAKPYRKNDIDREKEFNEVVKRLFDAIDQDKHIFDTIILNAKQNYAKEMQHAELIVRVPHLHAFYKDQKTWLEEQKKNCRDLFKFFHEKVLGDLKTEIPKWSRRHEINGLNEKLGVIPKLKKSSYKFEPLKIEEVTKLFNASKICIQVIQSDVNFVTLSKYYSYLKDTNFEYIFLEASALKDKIISAKISKMINSDNKMFVIMECTKISDIVSKEFLHFVMSDINLFLIANEVICKKAVEKIERCELFISNENIFIKKTPDELNFLDFTKDCQQKLLEKDIKFQGSAMKLCDLVPGNSRILNVLPVKKLVTRSKLHVRIPVGNKMFQKFESHFFIDRKFLIQKQPTELEGFEGTINENIKNGKMISIIEISTDKFINEFLENKIAVITGGPGIGKSASLHHIYNKILAAKLDGYKWIEFIDLKQCVDNFSAMGSNQITFNRFFENLNVKKTPEFEMKLFGELYDNGRSIFLVDGFDEISPTYKETVLNLLKTFNRNSGNKLCITSRSHLKEDLEQNLKCSSFSYSLKPFEEEEQVSFLTKLKVSEKEAKTFVATMQTKMTNQQSLLSTPMLLQMIADIQNGNISIFSDLDNFTIYDKFIARLLKIWAQKGEIAEESQTRLSMNHANILEIHQRLALYYFFKHEKEVLESFLESSQITFDEISLGGIITINNLDNFHFLHETFAEYFVAGFLIRELKTSKEIKEETVEIILKVMTNQDFTHIRQIFEEQIFLKDCTKLLDALFGVMVQENGKIIIRSKTGVFKMTIFSRFSVKTSHPKILRRLIEIAKEFLNESEFTSWLKETNTEGETAFDRALMFNSNISVVNELWKVMEDNLTALECKEFILTKLNNIGNSIIIRCANKAQKAANLERLIEIAQSYLERSEFIDWLTETDSKGLRAVDHSFMYNSNISVVNAMWKVMQDNLSKKECKKLIVAKTGVFLNNMLMRSAAKIKNPQILFRLIEIAKTYHEPHEFINWLSEMNIDGVRAFEHTFMFNPNIEVLNSFWEVMQSNLSEEECKEFIMAKTGQLENNMIIRCANKTQNPEILFRLVEIAQSYLKPEKFIAWLKETNSEEETALDFAIMVNSNIDIVNALWNVIVSNVKKEEIKLFLVEKTGHLEKNIFKRCANGIDDSEILHRLVEIAQLYLDKNEFVDWLKERNSEGESAFDFAIMVNSNIGVVNTLWQVLQDNLSKEECKEFILLKTGQFKLNTIMRSAPNTKNPEILLRIIEIARTNLTADEFISWLTQASTEGSTAIDHAFMFNPNINVANALWRVIEKELSEGECKELLISTDEKYENTMIIRCANKTQNPDVLLRLIEIVKNYLAGDEFKCWLKKTNSENSTAFDRALMFNSNIDVVNALWQVIQDNLSEEECKEFILRRTSTTKKNTIMRCAQQTQNPEILHRLVEIAKSYLKHDEFITWFKEIDTEGLRAIDYGVMFNSNIDVMNALWKEIQNQEECKEVIVKKTGNFGKNCLMRCAESSMSPQILNRLVEIAFSHLETIEFTNWLTNVDTQGLRAIDHAFIFNSNVNVVNELWRVMEERLGRKDCKELIVEKTSLFEKNMIMRCAESLGNPQNLHRLLEIADLYLDKEEFIQWLMEIDVEGSRAFDRAIMFNSSIDVVNALWSVTEKKFGKQDCKKFLLTKLGHLRNNVIMLCACKTNNPKMLLLLLEIAKKYLNTNEMFHWLNEKNSEGATAFDYALTFNRNIDILNALWKVMEESLENFNYENLLFQEN